MEFDAFGVPKGERVARFEDYLTLVQRLWTEESVSYQRFGINLHNVHMNIRPVQKPRPPIWLAANNDPAVKRAARMADAWFINPHATIDTIRRQMAVYRAELKAAGKGRPARAADRQGGVLRHATGRPRSRWRGPTCWRNTATTPSGARTR